MTISDDILTAFIDGELDEDTRRRVEAAERDDPDVRRRLAVHRRLRSRLQAAFAPTLDEPVPARLLAAVRKPTASARKFVIGAWPAFGSLAASIVVGLGVGFAIWHGSDGPLKISSEGEVVAGGSLDRALSTQLAAEHRPEGAAAIGLSFLAKSGTYCRTFSLSNRDAAIGLACREGERWRIQLLAPAPPDESAGSDYRTAGSNLPPRLRSRIESEMQGEPLTREEEEAARRAHWRSR